MHKRSTSIPSNRRARRIPLHDNDTSVLWIVFKSHIGWMLEMATPLNFMRCLATLTIFTIATICGVSGLPPKPDPGSSAVDPHVNCFTPADPPRPRGPYPQINFPDAVRVSEKIGEWDTSRPPQLTTWAKKGDFPAGVIDFEVPIIVDHGTCRALISLRPGYAGFIDEAYVEWFVEGVPYIVWACSQQGQRTNWGGRRFYGHYLLLTVLGKTAPAPPGSALSANETILQLLPANGTKASDEYVGAIDPKLIKNLSFAAGNVETS